MPRQGMSVMREQTKRFIDENPTTVTLSRHTRVQDGAGGYTETSGSISPQVVRLIPQARAVSVERRTVDGVMLTPDANLMMEWDADVMIGDKFTWQTRKMEVIWVHDTGYEKIAEVAVR